METTGRYLCETCFDHMTNHVVDVRGFEEAVCDACIGPGLDDEPKQTTTFTWESPSWMSEEEWNRAYQGEIGRYENIRLVETRPGAGSHLGEGVVYGEEPIVVYHRGIPGRTIYFNEFDVVVSEEVYRLWIDYQLEESV